MSAERGALVYDGDCSFCMRFVHWLSRDSEHFDIRAWQSIADLESVGLDAAVVTTAAFWIETPERPIGGAMAIARAASACPGWRGLLGWLIGSRAAAPVAANIYAYVSANRHKMPGGTAGCHVDERREAQAD